MAQTPPMSGASTATTTTGTLKVAAKAFENPSLSPIPPQMLKQIETGKYVDMGDLLPEALSVAFDKSQRETKEDPIATSKRKFPINTPLDWALAFSTYSAVVTHFHPAKASQLITYSNIVLCLAREVRGKVWFHYDRAFCQTAAIQTNIRWDRREPDVWLAAMSEDSCTPTKSTVTAQPDPASEPASARRKRPGDDELCFRYNRGECTSRTCRFRHKCLVCQSSDHYAKICPILQPVKCRYSSPTPTKEVEKKENLT